MSGYGIGYVDAHRALVWPPAWRLLTTDSDVTLRGRQRLHTGEPTGHITQPFLLWHFCLRAETAGTRMVTVQTTSRGRGKADTMMYVADATDSFQRSGGTAAAESHLKTLGFGRNVHKCVHSQIQSQRTMPRDGCNEDEKPLTLSRLVFYLPASPAVAHGMVTNEQRCFRAYVLLRAPQRMVADAGLTVTVT